MTWTISILISVVMFTGHILAVRYVGEKFPSTFVTPAFYTFALVMLYTLFFIDRPKFEWGEVAQPSVLIPLIFAGVTIGLTDFFFVKSLNLGADASIALPILSAGAAVLVTILGFLIFKESLSFYKLAGIVLAISGIFLIHKG
ncbi:MAG: EamA family transporter [Alphaproteobacteria bacterium]|nr:EamA family transporter [Alphaproteobacteria bacterium]MCB9985412.1 EamA family transporter [Micavibrio sp.]